MKQTPRTVAAFLTCLLLAGCALSSREPPGPRAVTLGQVASERTQTLDETNRPLQESLARELGRPVRIMTTQDYDTLIAALGSGEVDVAILPPLSYVIARQKHGVQPLFMVKRFDKASGKEIDVYRGAFYVRKGSPIRTLEDARGGRLAVVSVRSGSGYLYPMALLHKRGIDPQGFFSEVSYLGRHDKVLFALLEGQADLGVTYDDARVQAAQERPEVMHELEPIAFTEWIPNDTLAVRGDLEPRLREQLQRALPRLLETPEGRAAFLKVNEVTGLRAVTDADFDVVREVARLLQ